MVVRVEPSDRREAQSTIVQPSGQLISRSHSVGVSLRSPAGVVDLGGPDFIGGGDCPSSLGQSRFSTPSRNPTGRSGSGTCTAGGDGIPFPLPTFTGGTVVRLGVTSSPCPGANAVGPSSCGGTRFWHSSPAGPPDPFRHFAVTVGAVSQQRLGDREGGVVASVVPAPGGEAGRPREARGDDPAGLPEKLPRCSAVPPSEGRRDVADDPSAPGVVTVDPSPAAGEGVDLLDVGAVVVEVLPRSTGGVAPAEGTGDVDSGSACSSSSSSASSSSSDSGSRLAASSTARSSASPAVDSSAR